VLHAGQPLPSRALVSYPLLAAAGLPQGARRTTSELERECRELGLSVSLLQGARAPHRRRHSDRRVSGAGGLALGNSPQPGAPCCARTQAAFGPTCQGVQSSS
jgi:hypothetical protein